MSNIKLQGNVSGTGSLTIAAPNTNTDRTLTLPDESGTLLSSGSASISINGDIAAVNSTSSGVQCVGDEGALELFRSDSTSYIDFKTTAAEDFDCRIQQQSNGLIFQTGGAGSTRRVLTLESNGNLAVNNPDIANKGVFLTYDNGAGVSYVFTGHAAGVGSGEWFAGFGYNGTAIGSIGQSGTTGVSYNTTSDYRLKENVQPLTGALARVAALNPVTYTWKTAPDEIGEGFIAHELAEVCPQAVTGEKDAVDEEGNPKYQGIDTSFLVATLTAAIQEQQAIINALTARIEALEAK